MTTDNRTPKGEIIYSDFVDVNPELDADDYEREVARLDDCYIRVCDGTPYTILARPARAGEAPGHYAETASGLQILGYSVPVPEDVQDLIRQAWDLYCDQ